MMCGRVGPKKAGSFQCLIGWLERARVSFVEAGELTACEGCRSVSSLGVGRRTVSALLESVGAVRNVARFRCRVGASTQKQGPRLLRTSAAFGGPRRASAGWFRRCLSALAATSRTTPSLPDCARFLSTWASRGMTH